MTTIYYIEQDDLDKLQAVTNRLGDMQTITHAQRRDLMNSLSLIVSNIRKNEAERLE